MDRSYDRIRASDAQPQPSPRWPTEVHSVPIRSPTAGPSHSCLASRHLAEGDGCQIFLDAPNPKSLLLKYISSGAISASDWRWVAMGPLRGASAILGVLLALSAGGCGAEDVTGEVAGEVTETADIADAQNHVEARFEGFIAPVDVAEEIIGDIGPCLPDCTDDPCSDDDGCGDFCAACEKGFVCVVEDDLAVCKDGCSSICLAVECGKSSGCECGPCDDGNLCTIDTCVLGLCSYLPNELPCDDGDICTIEDACSWGKCAGGTLKECDDGKVCTVDTCLPETGCEYTPDVSLCGNGQGCLTFVCDPIADCVATIVSNGEPCDDGNMCSQNNVCSEGTCQPGEQVDCDDGADCTIDSCDSNIGCVNAAIDGLCEDDDVCDGLLFCVPQIGCGSGPPLDCDDHVGCTADSCDPVLGCLNEVIELFCDDGNLCTGEEYCGLDSGCLPGVAIVCDDGSECTTDVCDPQSGQCDFELVAGGEPCQYDGNACVETAVCVGGTCEPDTYVDCSDGLDCTMDACSPEIGCVSVPEHAFCPHLETDCASGHCDPENGCVQIPKEDGVPCDLGDVCTVNDTCLAGSCNVGEEIDCSDDVPCTWDECTPFVGCENTPDDAECSDGDDCNGLEVCDLADGCLPGVPSDCD
jgi:hypothetical protein